MFFNPMDNRSLYNLVDYMKQSIQPYSDYFNFMFTHLNRMSNNLNLPMNIPYISAENNASYGDARNQSLYHVRKLAAWYYVAHMLTRKYEKPEFNITDVSIDDEYCGISEIVVEHKSFCNLLHFKKLQDTNKPLPKVLLVAPMSGHHATLLRSTVIDMLPHFDVYITDWKDARSVPLLAGSFDLDEFAQYIVSFIKKLGPDVHVMAVCQPTVPVLVAAALMSTDEEATLPDSLILIGGPIDTSQSPTAVNDLAVSRRDDWFKQSVISIVPSHYPGAMRLVFPGFMQLSGFLSMNIQRHLDSINKAVENWAENKEEEAMKTLRFYNEYFSTMDLTAEFYIQTINSVFQEKLLTKGRYKSRGRQVRLQDIKHSAILAIEGELDDITGVGQTKSVLAFCKNLPDDMKRYYLAKKVGHYGLFSGRKFQKIILPEIIKFIHQHNNNKPKPAKNKN